MREYVVTCCSTADMSRTFMETNEVPFAMFHYQLDGKDVDDTSFTTFYNKHINITAQKRLTEEYKPEGDPAYAFSFTGTDGTTITAGYYEYDTNFYAAVVGDKVYLINKMNVRDLADAYDTMINGSSEEEKQSESDSTESDAEDTAEATATSEK